MNLVICNRCGKRVHEPQSKFLGILEVEKWIKFKWSDEQHLEDDEYQEFDLCEDCGNAVFEFITNHPKVDLGKD